MCCFSVRIIFKENLLAKISKFNSLAYFFYQILTKLQQDDLLQGRPTFLSYVPHLLFKKF